MIDTLTKAWGRWMQQRTATQQELILERLRCGSATNEELTKIGLRYSARIYDLRRKGYDIDTKTLKGGLVQYRLVAEPSPRLAVETA